MAIKGSVGMTEILSYHEDDLQWYLPNLQFPIEFYGSTYDNIYPNKVIVSSNSYIGFGGFNEGWSGYSVGINDIKGISIFNDDRSAQKIYYDSQPNSYRIRWEGNSDFSGGGTAYNWELTFFSDGVIQIDIENVPVPEGYSFITNDDGSHYDYITFNPNDCVWLTPEPLASSGYTISQGMPDYEEGGGSETPVSYDYRTKQIHSKNTTVNPATKQSHTKSVTTNPATKISHTKTVQVNPTTKIVHTKTVQTDPTTKIVHIKSITYNGQTNPQLTKGTTSNYATQLVISSSGITFDTSYSVKMVFTKGHTGDNLLKLSISQPVQNSFTTKQAWGKSVSTDSSTAQQFSSLRAYYPTTKQITTKLYVEQSALTQAIQQVETYDYMLSQQLIRGFIQYLPHIEVDLEFIPTNEFEVSIDREEIFELSSTRQVYVDLTIKRDNLFDVEITKKVEFDMTI